MTESYSAYDFKQEMRDQRRVAALRAVSRAVNDLNEGGVIKLPTTEGDGQVVTIDWPELIERLIVLGLIDRSVIDEDGIAHVTPKVVVAGYMLGRDIQSGDDTNTQLFAPDRKKSTESQIDRYMKDWKADKPDGRYSSNSTSGV